MNIGRILGGAALIGTGVAAGYVVRGLMDKHKDPTRIDTATGKIMAEFDTDAHKGALSIAKEAVLEYGDVYYDNPSFSSEGKINITALLRDADENDDGQVTRGELKDELSGFDHDDNGRLSDVEYGGMRRLGLAPLQTSQSFYNGRENGGPSKGSLELSEFVNPFRATNRW